MDAWTIVPAKVSPVGEEDPVLLEHSVHRLVLATNRVPIKPKANSEPFSGGRNPERSPKAEADFILAKNVDKSFIPLGFPVWLDKYFVTWRERLATKVPGFSDPTFEDARTLFRKSGHVQAT